MAYEAAACEEKEGVWEDALWKLTDKQWKEPGEACSAETLDPVVTVCDDVPPSAAAGRDP